MSAGQIGAPMGKVCSHCSQIETLGGDMKLGMEEIRISQAG